VDENLFYKSVDKEAVHNARLNQSHSLAEPGQNMPLISGPAARPDLPVSYSQDQEEERPPYPYDTGASLLALTHKHNVCDLMLIASLCISSHIVR
jgi:hypothetical protein